METTQANLVTDDSFGTRTQATVMQFQRNHSLAVDGIVGDHTWAKLREIVDPRFLRQMFDDYNPSAKPHQTRAIGWLQNQISRSTLTEFARRWRTA